ncbi:Translation factor guf1 mitochondrial [Serendipita sp. 407]|nr:Translation factor guf1 mitochondrial [Serendipita sp. 407]
MDLSEWGDSPATRTFLLNLIDTPVTRSQAACQGALLLIDSTQGIQAQTISVYHSAKERGLKIIPILNKIDLPAADVDRVTNQLETTFGIDPSEILHVSAKTGFGVDGVLQEIVRRIPPPPGRISAPLRALLFDSLFTRPSASIIIAA